MFVAVETTVCPVGGLFSLQCLPGGGLMGDLVVAMVTKGSFVGLLVVLVCKPLSVLFNPIPPPSPISPTLDTCLHTQICSCPCAHTHTHSVCIHTITQSQGQASAVVQPKSEDMDISDNDELGEHAPPSLPHPPVQWQAMLHCNGGI